MGKNSKQEYFRQIYTRYRAAGPEEKSRILDEFCKVCGYNRKYAISKLNGPAPEKDGAFSTKKRHRGNLYTQAVIAILAIVWVAAGYICSVRLKAVVRLWLPWIRERFQMSPSVEKGLLAISARQIDRRLQSRKRQVRKGIYGRTKPGTLLKHQIPIKTDHWNVKSPGFTEVDLVSHSGSSAAGEFAHSLNQTDILSTWVETRAVLGKSEIGVVNALDEMRQALPFTLAGIDSDNGSEFINGHLFRYCRRHGIQFTRGRPYKKDDNAHIEQKNWTHVRKLFGWMRYDSQEAIEAINDVYRNELRWFMNLFTPSMKLQRKIRIGSRIRKLYDVPKTPLDRLIAAGKGNADRIGKLVQLRESLNLFELATTIETKLHRIYKLSARSRISPNGNTLRKPCSKTSTNSIDASSNYVDDTNTIAQKLHALTKTKPQSTEEGWHSLGSLLKANLKELNKITGHDKK